MLPNTSNSDSSRIFLQPVLSSTTGEMIAAILSGLVPYRTHLLKVHYKAAWHQAVYGGCVLTAYTRHVCFSVGGIWVRNNLPRTSYSWGTAWKPTQVWPWKTQGKAGGTRAADWNTLLRCLLLRHSSRPGISDPCRLKPRCRSPPLLLHKHQVSNLLSWTRQKAIGKGWEVNQALFFIRAFPLFAVFPLIY